MFEVLTPGGHLSATVLGVQEFSGAHYRALSINVGFNLQFCVLIKLGTILLRKLNGIIRTKFCAPVHFHFGSMSW